MKRCSKGKSCGGSCISKNKRCSVTLDPKSSQSLSKANSFFLNIIEDKKGKEESEKGGWSSFMNMFPDSEGDPQVSEDTRRAREDSEDYDEEFESKRDAGYRGFGGAYDWSNSYKEGSKNLGEGSYGFVVASKPPPDAVVKRGEITLREVKILEKLSGKGVAPDLLAAELGSKVSDEVTDLYEGRVAMARVRGSISSDFSRYGDTAGGVKVGDSYWSLRKRLHSQGVAHNDSHPENVIIGKNGEAKFVDFGLSQDNPKAAFSEAIGIFGGDRKFLPRGSVTSKPIGKESGDWQGSKFSQFTEGSLRLGMKIPENSNLKRLTRNRLNVFSSMRKLGLSDDEVADIVVGGIRRPESDYEKGAWGKLSKGDAEELIQILYKGID